MQMPLVYVFFILIFSSADAITWEKLYSLKSTDCFRPVKEVPERLQDIIQLPNGKNVICGNTIVVSPMSSGIYGYQAGIRFYKFASVK
jgi:hypothetical protein